MPNLRQKAHALRERRAGTGGNAQCERSLRRARPAPQANSVDALGLPVLKLTAVYTPAGTSLSGVDFSMFFAQMQAARSYTGAPGVRVQGSHAAARPCCALRRSAVCPVHDRVACWREHSRVQLGGQSLAVRDVLSITAGWGGAGIRLTPGTYSVSGFSARRQHFYFACSPSGRSTPFTVDFGGSTLIFQVRRARRMQDALLLAPPATQAEVACAGCCAGTAHCCARLWAGAPERDLSRRWDLKMCVLDKPVPWCRQQLAPFVNQWRPVA